MITEYSRLPICTSRRAAGRRRRGGRALDEESAPPLDGNVLVGEVFSPNVVQTPDQIVAPEEVPFAQPVTLTFTYREEDLPLGMSEANFFVYRYDLGSQSWVRVPGQVIDTERNMITVQVEHFSEYSIQALRAMPPDLQTMAGLGVAAYQDYFQESNENVSPSSANSVRHPVRHDDLHLRRFRERLQHDRRQRPPPATSTTA